MTAGRDACACEDPGRKERADASHFTLSQQRVALAASPPRETMRRVASTGHLTGGGMKRVASGSLRRPPSAGNLQTVSRNSGGSELFDALLQAATAGALLLARLRDVRVVAAGGAALGQRAAVCLFGPCGWLCCLLPTAGRRAHFTKRLLRLLPHLPAAADQDGALAVAGPSHGDPPVTSRHYAAAQLGRQRSRMWASHNEVDSLQAAMDDFQVGGGTAGSQPGSRL